MDASISVTLTVTRDLEVAIKRLVVKWVTVCGQINHLSTTKRRGQLSLLSLRGR